MSHSYKKKKIIYLGNCILVSIFFKSFDLWTLQSNSNVLHSLSEQATSISARMFDS